LVDLVVGGELGGGVALLRLAALHLLSQPLPKELTFNMRIYVDGDRYYNVAAYGTDARGLCVSSQSLRPQSAEGGNRRHIHLFKAVNTSSTALFSIR